MPFSLHQRLQIVHITQPIVLLIIFLTKPIPIANSINWQTIALVGAVIVLLIGSPIHTNWGRSNASKLIIPVLWATITCLAILIGLQPNDSFQLLHGNVWFPHFVIAAFIVPHKATRHFLLCCIVVAIPLMMALSKGVPVAEYSRLSAETIIILLFALLSTTIVILLERTKKRERDVLTQLQIAEKQYRTIFEGAQDGIYQATIEGRFLAVNQSMVEILGYDSRDELLSDSFVIERDLYVAPQKRAENLAMLRNGGKLSNSLIQAKRKNGELIWLSLNVQFVQDSQNQPVLTGYVRDVTKAEKIKLQVQEQQLAYKQSQQRNLAIVNTIPDIMIWYTQDGYYREVILRDWYKPMGSFAADAVIGKHVTDVLPEKSADLVLENLNRAIETGETQTYRFGPTRHNQYLEGRATPSADGNILVTSRDITQEVEAEITLLSRDAILSSIGFSTEQLLRTVAWQDVITPVLQQLGEATDVSRTYLFQAHNDSNNVPVVSIRHEWNADHVKAATEQSHVHNEPQAGILSVWWDSLRAGGTVQVVTSQLEQGPVRDLLEAQSVKVLVLVPITVGGTWWGFIGLDNCTKEHAWSKQELDALRIAAANLGAAIEREQTLAALLEVQKSESIGILAGGIAHDFNNLLTSVLGQASLASAKLSDDHPAKRHVARSVKSAQKAANLTQQLLAYAGKGQVAIAPIDLNVLVSDNVELLTTVLPATVEVNFSLDAANCTVIADKVHMQQLVMNLVINAGDAMSKNGGQLTVESYNELLDEPLVAHHFRGNQTLAAGEYFVLSISDTGIGMSEATLTSIFDPYFTTKSTGHGLGLSATLGIVNTLGGSLHVTSSEGVGTTFSVWLPVHQESMQLESDRIQRLITSQPS